MKRFLLALLLPLIIAGGVFAAGGSSLELWRKTDSSTLAPYNSAITTINIAEVCDENDANCIDISGGVGTGDVVGPASATDTAMALWDSTTGKLLKDGVVLQDASGNFTVVGDITGTAGQMTITGGTASGDDLLFASTTDATTGLIGFTSLTQGFIWDEDLKALAIGADEFDMSVGGVTKGSTITTHSNGGVNAYDVAFHRHSSSSGTFLSGARSRGSEGSETVVQDNDNLLDIYGLGHDGTDYEFGAGILLEVDGTPGAGDMPGRIVFQTTPDESATLVEAMRIDNAGDIDFGVSGMNVTVAGVSRKKTVVLTANSANPTTTSGATATATVEAGTNDIDYRVVDYDPSTEERAFWNFTMPDSWDGGTITAQFSWTNSAGLSTETVDWGIKGLCLADDGAIDQAYGTEITTTDTFIAQGDVHISATSSAMTFAGSPAGGNYCILNVGRKVATDDLTGDARLLSVKIEYGVSTFSD